MKILNFLHDFNKVYAKTIMETFGEPNLTDEQKLQLKGMLDALSLTFMRLDEQIQEATIETPLIFQNMPDVVRFVMTRYFLQMPYGERQAILSEFNKEQSLAPQKAVKRFFEVTGMDKVGQFLSTRRDLIPEDYRKELETFQEEVEPSSFDEVRRTIEKELGGNLNDLYASFNPNPINAGTIGEVYEAYTHDGKKVAVKVITPSKRKVIAKTLDRLRHVSHDLQFNKERFPGAFDPLAIYKEFKESMEEELDFGRERKNAEEIRKDLPDYASIPEYITELSSTSVLTQSFAEGVHIRDLPKDVIRQIVVQRLGRLLFYMFVRMGKFHDDLHPGNFRVDPNTADLELLDFGRVGRVNRKEKRNLLPLLNAIKEQNVSGIISNLSAVSTSKEGFDSLGLEEELHLLMTSGEVTGTALINKIVFACGKYNLGINPGYLRVVKAVMSFEGTAKELLPDFNLEQFMGSIEVNRLLYALGFAGIKLQ